MENFDLTGLGVWADLILALLLVAEVIVRLTPSEEDNSVVNKIANLLRQLINFLVPNRDKNGGTHA
jgi:hypothetical protein